MNWIDLRYVLAAARGGTLAAAARAVSADATTVARRLAASERTLGARLFDRIDGRLVPTAAGEVALQRAEAIEQEMLALEQAIGGRDGALWGSVRMTSVNALLCGYLVPRLGDFRVRYPDIVLELVADTSHLNLSRREADLALRMSRPEGGGVVTRRLARLAYAVYAGRELTARAGADPAQLPWIRYEDRYAHLPEAQWVARRYPGAPVVLRASVGVLSLEAVRAGLGVALLPCYLADVDPDLRRLGAPVSLREVWLILHADLKRTARVRALADWLAAQFERDAALFAGGTQHPPVAAPA
ncbi:MAG: LysR family transcriptional regulator [Gammaproteobacteria bacterium]|nr:LysR family transcriptional regulator [Gammaproteobacteria bacterium]